MKAKALISTVLPTTLSLILSRPQPGGAIQARMMRRIRRALSLFVVTALTLTQLGSPGGRSSAAASDESTPIVDRGSWIVDRVANHESRITKCECRTRAPEPRH